MTLIHKVCSLTSTGGSPEANARNDLSGTPPLFGGSPLLVGPDPTKSDREWTTFLRFELGIPKASVIRKAALILPIAADAIVNAFPVGSPGVNGYFRIGLLRKDGKWNTADGFTVAKYATETTLPHMTRTQGAVNPDALLPGVLQSLLKIGSTQHFMGTWGYTEDVDLDETWYAVSLDSETWPEEAAASSNRLTPRSGTDWFLHDLNFYVRLGEYTEDDGGAICFGVDHLWDDPDDPNDFVGSNQDLIQFYSQAQDGQTGIQLVIDYHVGSDMGARVSTGPSISSTISTGPQISSRVSTGSSISGKAGTG